MNLSFAIITCSDTRDIASDEAGGALASLVDEAGWTVVEHVVVHDERARIASQIVHAVDELAADIVITCGGTGLSPRDVTPESTRDACERDVPGIAEALRAYSMTKTRRAMLSRGVCMQRGKSLVVNFPGSTKAARENWEAIADQFEHAVRMATGEGH